MATDDDYDDDDDDGDGDDGVLTMVMVMMTMVLIAIGRYIRRRCWLKPSAPLGDALSPWQCP